MPKHIIYTKYLLILFVFFSCGNKDNIKVNNFQKIDLQKFTKKKVAFKTSFLFLNENNFDITILNSDFDIFVNGTDVASHINNESFVLKANRSISIPIIAEFKPSKIFKDYKTGIRKIKSDIVANVEIKGIIKIVSKEEEKELEYNGTQIVLFTNNKKIQLNDKNEIVDK